MNLDFYTKFSSTNDGLMAASAMKSSGLDKGLKEGSTSFKDLLAQTKNEKDQSAIEKSVSSSGNSQNILSDEKLSGKENKDNTSDPLKEGSLLELLPEKEKIPIDENNKDNLNAILENGLMNYVQSTPQSLSTPIITVEENLQLVTDNLEMTNATGDVSQQESQLIENTTNAAQGDQLSGGKEKGGQTFKSVVSPGSDHSAPAQSQESLEQVPGKVNPTLSDNTKAAQKTVGSEGQVEVTPTEQSRESLEAIQGKVNPTLSDNTKAAQKTVGSEGQVEVTPAEQPRESLEAVQGKVNPTLSDNTKAAQKAMGSEGQVEVIQTEQPPGKVNPTLSDNTKAAQKAMRSEGKINIVETEKSVKSPETISGEINEVLSKNTETKKKTMGTEDQNGSIQRKGEEVPLINMVPMKNAEVQTSDTVGLSGQIEQKIMSQLEENKPITFQMKLDPENLGEIDVQLKFDQGKLTIDITAFSKDTQALLLGQIDKLIKGLALQNVQVESVHLNNQTHNQNSSGTDSKAFLMNMGMDFTQSQKQTFLRDNFRNQNNLTKNADPDGDQELGIGIVGNEQSRPPRYHKINVLI